VKPPKTAREEWEKIVDYAARADEDAVADMSEEEVDRALAKAGFDVEKETAIGRAQHDASVARAKEAPRKARAPRGSRWLGAPAALLVAAGVALEIAAPPALTGVGDGKPDAGPAVTPDAAAEDGGPDGATRAR
jgi:hypothetical protein